MTDKEMIDAYFKYKNVHKAGESLGIKGQALHYRLKKLGVTMDGSGKKWTEHDDKDLILLYEGGIICGDGKLDLFSEKKNRTKQFICRKAKKLGLTLANRTVTPENAKKASINLIRWHENNAHPKGFSGGVHTEEARKAMSEASISYHANCTEQQLSERIMKQLKTREKNGTLYPKRTNATWKAGWREIGGYKKYYRSRWEANYARYLEWLKINGEITEWLHEPETFWFENIKRGVRSYLPDFKVTENNGDIKYHEVKGWMDSKSATKLKRMKKYHPEIKMVLIQKKEYEEIATKLGYTINEWEGR